MPEFLGEARLRLTADATRLESTLKRTKQKLRTAGVAMAATGAALLAPIALGVKTFASYEQEMAKVQAVSGATTEQFTALDAIAREMGRTTVFTANQSAEALAFMSMAGLEARESIAALPDVLNLAAAGQLELGQSADIVTNVMAGYGIAAEDVTRAVDVLTKGFTSANTDLSQLGEAFKMGGPVAKAAGLNFEEVAAALSLMGNAGFQGSLAGTALRGAITRLLNPTDEARALLERYGVTVLDSTGKMRPLVEIMQDFERDGLTAADAMAIFGQRAGPALLALLEQGSEGLRELTTEMENAGGTAEDIARTQLDTFNGQMTLMKSALEGVFIEIGKALIPALRGLLDTITPIIAKVADWAERNPKLTKTLVLIAAALGTFLLVMGAVTLAISAAIPAVMLLVTAMIALVGPIGVAIAIIGALGVAAVLLWRNWDRVTGWLSTAWDKVVAAVQWAHDRVVDFFRSMWQAIPDLIRQPLESLMEVLWSLPSRISDALASIPGKFSDVFENAFKGAISWIAKGRLLMALQQFPPQVGDAISGIPDIFETTFRAAHDKAGQTLDSMLANVRSFGTGAASVGQDVAVAWEAAMEGVARRTSSMFASVGDAWGAALDGIVSSGRKVYDAFMGGKTQRPLGERLSHIPAMLQTQFGAGPGGMSQIMEYSKQHGVSVNEAARVINQRIRSRAMAAGGIVTAPTLAMIGEAGPEAVIPLSDGRARMGTTINVRVEGNVLDGEDFAEKVSQALLVRQRQGLFAEFA